MKLIMRMLADVLLALYQPFWAAVLLTVLASLFYLFCTGTLDSGKGYGYALREWSRMVRGSSHFRGLLLLIFCTALILSRTLLFRQLHVRPLSNVLGVWHVWRTSANGSVSVSTECVENTLMLMPFSFMLLWVFGERLAPAGRLGEVVRASVKVSFLFSLGIETLQLVLCLGRWQLSDVVFNTLGGLLGGLVYWVVHKLRARN